MTGKLFRDLCRRKIDHVGVLTLHSIVKTPQQEPESRVHDEAWHLAFIKVPTELEDRLC